jgi:hypothetical protein
MFQCRHDPLRALAVIVLAPPALETDIDEYVASVKMLDAVGANREGSALVLVLESGYPLPDAGTRKRGVDARKDMKSRPVVSVVTSNPLLRAALVAAHWISPPPFEQHIAATFDEAVRYIEAKRGPTLGLLERMYGESSAHLALRRSPRA